MTTAIETREVISVTTGGTRLWGTYHRSHGKSGLAEGPAEKNRIGVLFLNPGFQPRAAQGDSSVYWADSFAKCGYPSFRFDLPGLGDSEGDVPEPMLDFVNAGGYAPVVAAVVGELVKRYSLSGMVVGGLCAGAVTALYTGAVSQECRGVLMMDPYFYQTRDKRPRIRVALTNWSSWSRLGALVSKVYDQVRYLVLRLRGNRPPRNANFPLLRCWKQLAPTGMPILLLKAPSVKAEGIRPRVGEFDYLSYLQALSGRGSRVAVKFIGGTNHSFADSLGRAAVREHTEQWLNAHFPSVEREATMALNRSR
jgi:pimeloyl-ACP methyl ester carboxylesterase